MYPCNYVTLSGQFWRHRQRGISRKHWKLFMWTITLKLHVCSCTGIILSDGILMRFVTFRYYNSFSVLFLLKKRLLNTVYKLIDCTHIEIMSCVRDNTSGTRDVMSCLRDNMSCVQDIKSFARHNPSLQKTVS